MKKERVLFVDDEVNLLRALKRQFHRMFDMAVAGSGAEGLQKIKSEEPYAVIVSDMQMPEMNGIQFLTAAQELSPDSVRIMLTGNADQKTAMDAVNLGNVFSFYTKPCTPQEIHEAVNKAIKQHHLIIAERELLEGTVKGTVKFLTEMLSMMDAEAFGRTLQIQEKAIRLAKAAGITDVWNLKMAIMLCNVANVTLPSDTLARKAAGEQLSVKEEQMILRLPEVSSKLIANIPRLEKVANIILYQNKCFDGSGFPEDGLEGDELPIESRIISISRDMESEMAKGVNAEQAFKALVVNQTHYDKKLLKCLSTILEKYESSHSGKTVFNSSISGLKPGHVLASNIETEEGKLLFASGQVITDAIIERLMNYSQITVIKEPVQVTVDDDEENETIAQAS